jgi:hypothetical protein
MTQQELWRAYCARNPSFDGSGEVTMTASGLKKLFDQTWQLAYAAGEANEKERSARLTDESSCDPFTELLRKYKR